MLYMFCDYLHTIPHEGVHHLLLAVLLSAMRQIGCRLEVSAWVIGHFNVGWAVVGRKYQPGLWTTPVLGRVVVSQKYQSVKRHSSTSGLKNMDTDIMTNPYSTPISLHPNLLTYYMDD